MGHLQNAGNFVSPAFPASPNGFEQLVFQMFIHGHTLG
jgi:hypothetical protein